MKMNYKEGRQARRERKYKLATELFLRGTVAGCLECAFELYMSQENNAYCYPEAEALLESAQSQRYLCVQELTVPEMVEKFIQSDDMFVKAMGFLWHGMNEEADEWFYRSWKEENNPHAAFQYQNGTNVEGVLFAATEGIAAAQYLAHDKKTPQLLEDAAIQGHFNAINDAVQDLFHLEVPENVVLAKNFRLGAQLILLSHKTEAEPPCALGTRLEFVPNDEDFPDRCIELYEYGKYIYYNGVPTCVPLAKAITARELYFATKQNARAAVLCWMWTELLPYDLMWLIGRRYVWDSTHDDPNVWIKFERLEPPLKK